jgi:lipopolysaccharide transport system ATP-binding protein
MDKELAADTQGTVISVDGVSVQYRVPQERIGTFKEYMIRYIQRQIKHNTFLALDNISLNVNRGEVFGIIGENGAGKSTLLKLIAKVLRPTRGRIWVKGRVAPLLEVGAGFHPELTGRENVYLNGAMLGFTQKEMDKRFQQIVDFAELWDFIDAPLRTYSSGMWARLGFAVATDVDPDILIVDEILSVGDENFQRKSSERIAAFREKGATILLVSHNMSLIEEMCDRAVLFDHGKVVTTGTTKAVVNSYLERVRGEESQRLAEQGILNENNRWGNQTIQIEAAKILGGDGKEQSVFHTGETLILEFEYHAHKPIEEPIFGVAIHRQDGVHITGPNTKFANYTVGRVNGKGKISYTIDSLPFLEGLYRFSVAATNSSDTEMFDYHDRVYAFRVDNHGWDVAEKFGMISLGGEWQHNHSS